jgi:DNA-binding response OmpR family regulator
MSTTSSSKSAILCIETRHIARLAEVNLDRQGYRVSTTPSTEGAISLLNRCDFDIALIDNAVSGGGYSLLEFIRTHELSADLKVIMLCQQEDLADLHSREFQADRYLPLSSSFGSWLGF